MENNIWFGLINSVYNGFDSKGNRLWEINRVKEAVVFKKISEEEYKQITGEDYIA